MNLIRQGLALQASSIARIIPADDTPLIDVALDAKLHGMRLMQNGHSVIATPCKVKGFQSVPVKVKA